MKTHCYREYKITEEYWTYPALAIFAIYDAHGEYLCQEKTLVRAKDWIDEQTRRQQPLIQNENQSY